MTTPATNLDSDGLPEDVLIVKVEDQPEGLDFRIKQEAVDRMEPLSLENSNNDSNDSRESPVASNSETQLNPALPHGIPETQTPDLPDFEDAENASTTATALAGAHDVNPSSDNSSALNTGGAKRPSIRYTVRNEMMHLTFSSRPTRPFAKALATFCERSGYAMDTTRWIFESERVDPEDTPQSVRLQVLQINSCQDG